MANVIPLDLDVLGVGQNAIEFGNEPAGLVNESWELNPSEFMADWDDTANQSGNVFPSENSCTFTFAIPLTDM
jgi:hypothetical protein